jgi:hypothetical protein
VASFTGQKVACSFAFLSNEPGTVLLLTQIIRAIHRYLMGRLPWHGFYLWRHLLSTATPFRLWLWKFEIYYLTPSPAVFKEGSTDNQFKWDTVCTAPVHSLGEYGAICETSLARESGPWGYCFMKKTEGQKSSGDTIPFNIFFFITCFQIVFQLVRYLLLFIKFWLSIVHIVNKSCYILPDLKG